MGLGRGGHLDLHRPHVLSWRYIVMKKNEVLKLKREILRGFYAQELDRKAGLRSHSLPVEQRPERRMAIGHLRNG
jgi:hypothetical protein